MLRRMFAVLARLRPRVVTLLLLASIAASIAVANLSGECGQRRIVPGPKLPANFWQKAFAGNPPLLVWKCQFDVREPTAEQSKNSNAMHCISFGWPLLWRQYLLQVGYGAVVVGENYSAARLAANLAIWLVMLAVPGAACEWLLRRYWPRLRFSLRTLLAAMGLVAALCAWYASARNRANVQDPLIAAINARSGRVWVERWGPKWLEALGADRLCRRVVGVELYVDGGDEEGDREGVRLLGELKRLPDLRYLLLRANSLPPETANALSGLQNLDTFNMVVDEFPRESGAALADALGSMKRLQMLSVKSDGADKMPRECLVAIGAVAQLERLHMEDCTIASEDLALLAGLTNLKSLTLENLDSETYGRPDPPLLSRLPALPRLESLDLEASYACDEDLRYLAVLPRLKSLGLKHTAVTDAGLAELAQLESLEELTLDEQAETAAGFKSLLKLKRLKSLHMELFDKESMESQSALHELFARLLPEDEIALEALRASKPGLVIDDADPFNLTAESMQPKCETLPAWSMEAAARQAVRVWKEQQAAAAASQGVVNPPPSQLPP